MAAPIVARSETRKLAARAPIVAIKRHTEIADHVQHLCDTMLDDIRTTHNMHVRLIIAETQSSGAMGERSHPNHQLYYAINHKLQHEDHGNNRLRPLELIDSIFHDLYASSVAAGTTNAYIAACLYPVGHSIESSIIAMKWQINVTNDVQHTVTLEIYDAYIIREE